jgi:uncharacterized protein YjbJ (UPF0337 family)
MTGVKKQVKGKARAGVGETKRAVGKATRNRSLEAKGVAETAKGKGKSTAGRAAQKVKGAT